MDTYSIFREFADSWGLLAMVLFFAGAVLYTFRPGSKKTHEDAANIPLRNDTPRDDDLPREAQNTPPKEA